MDPRIGTLNRNGTTIYYAHVGSNLHYVESESLAEVTFFLSLDYSR